MINTMADIVEAWYTKLHGSISVPVFIESAPDNQTGSYVLLRSESEADTPNKGYFGKNAVVIVDIITEFQNMVNTQSVDTIDGQINALVLPSPRSHGLTVSGFQIAILQAENSTYLSEDDGTRKIYRKVTRYNHLVNE